MTTILENIAKLEETWAEASSPPKSQRDHRAKKSQSLQSRINVRIKKQFELPHQKSGDKANLAKTFTRDLDSIQRHVDQWIEFVKELQRVSFFYKNARLLSDEQKAELSADVDQLFEDAMEFKLSDDKVLVDQLFKFDFEEMRLQLGSQLDKMVASFVKRIFSKLESLQQKNILGTIFWGAPDSCHFVDWHHEIIAEPMVDRLVDEREFTENNGFSLDTIREKTFGTGISAVHMATRREQHLVNTEQSRLSEFKLKIPSQFGSLLAKLPDIFKPEIRVISGEVFRNEKTEQCFGEKSWLGTRVERQVIERLEFGFDPAVVLGDTVLFAWDDEDSAKDAQKQDTLVHLIWALSCAAAAVALFVLLANQNLISKFLFVSPLLAVGVWLVMNSYKGHQIKLRKKNDDESAAKIGGGFLAVMVGLCTSASGLVTSNIPALVLSIGIVSVGLWIISKTLRFNQQAG